MAVSCQWSLLFSIAQVAALPWLLLWYIVTSITTSVTWASSLLQNYLRLVKSMCTTTQALKQSYSSFATCNVLHYLANCSKLEPGFYKLIDISASTVKGLWLVGFHSQQTHLESCIRAIYLCSCKSGICVFFLRKLSLFTRSICTVYVGDVPANTEFLFKFVLQPCWPAC